MAYVAKSQRVWDAINSNINKLFNERVQHANDWESYIDVKDFSRKCYRALIDEEMEMHMRALPKSFFSYEKEFSFKFEHLQKQGDGKPIKINAHFGGEFDEKMPFPSNWTSYYNEKHTINDKRLTDELKGPLCKRAAQIAAVDKDKDDFVRGAKEIYKKAKSINQLVKIWEPALSLLDADTIERLRRRVERNTSAEDQGISQEDLNKLNSHYVKAKVSQ